MDLVQAVVPSSEVKQSKKSALLGPLKLWRCAWLVVLKQGLEITILRCIKSQKSTDLIYITAEAWHIADPLLFPQGSHKWESLIDPKGESTNTKFAVKEMLVTMCPMSQILPHLPPHPCNSWKFAKAIRFTMCSLNGVNVDYVCKLTYMLRIQKQSFGLCSLSNIQ
jgi:hypothetical protein